MEDAGGGVEAEVLIGGYPWRKPALGCGPFDGEHVVCACFRLSIFPGFRESWGREGNEREGGLPVKVRPKTSSSWGTSSLGVVVFVTVSAEGFMPGSLAIASSCDCMLYGRRHCHCALDTIFPARDA